MKRLGIALVLASSLAHAQPADVPALTKLIENQPTDMDRTTWKDKRREAARKLVQSKDKRAVPVLIKLAESETFDIIGEIAIEGLGTLGDKSAVPVLQTIANDNGRDKTQRDLARKALARLGASAERPATGGTTGTTGTTGGTTTTTTPEPTPGDLLSGGGAATEPADPTPPPTEPTVGGGLLGERPAVAGLPALPAVPDDALGASERLTFALGTARLQYDTVRERGSFDFDVSGVYAKRVEREQMAWGWDAGAHVLSGFVNPQGREQVRGLQTNLTGNAEARFYGGKFYGVGKAALGFQLNYFKYKDDDDINQDDKETRYTADLQIALGGGYGRVLDVGGAIRVRRLSRTLDAAKALGKPIDAATARRLQLTWWSLRGERSSYRALVATVAILREAGVLLVEPDAGLTYELLAVLRDTQLFLRPSGLDVQLVFGEGYLVRPEDEDNPDGPPPSGNEGRVEQALLSVGYGKQLADDTLEVSATAYGRMRLFAPEDQPSPYAAGGTARVRRFTYGEHGDPFGALDLSLDLRFANDGNAEDDPVPGQDDDFNARIAGQVGFTYWMNQASGLRLAATVAADGGELFIGAQLEATYGLLDATFAGL